MSDIKYNRIDEDLQQKIISNRESHWINPYAFKDEMAVRRNNDIDKANLWRPVFVRDVEKIMHLPYYNRYADKTQVFSFKNNDDITRRAQHVQLVSRIARNIGSVLGLNLDLIEAIALGHDIGHTPFGHAGERFLSELYHNETNRYFNHNVHSARVLDTIFVRNFTMQTLDGVLCHNGEFEQQGYKPKYEKSFDDYDTEIESCYTEGIEAIKKLIPSTLEGMITFQTVLQLFENVWYRKSRSENAPLPILQTRGDGNFRKESNIYEKVTRTGSGAGHDSVSGRQRQRSLQGCRKGQRVLR